MVKFLTTTEITAEIEKLIKEADKRVTLISPFVDIPRALLQNLQSACDNHVEITLIYGKRQGAEDSDELKSEIKDQLSKLGTLTLRYLDNLHAKCYFNEHHMVITSMNLYDYSAHQNREMGILISAKDDKEVFDAAVREANDIIKRAITKPVKRNVLDSLKGLAKEAKAIIDSEIQGNAGFCIRCSKRIPLNAEQPLCHDCWEKWNIHKNSSFKEKYCHSCGKPARTTMAKPQCNPCYQSQR